MTNAHTNLPTIQPNPTFSPRTLVRCPPHCHAKHPAAMPYRQVVPEQLHDQGAVLVRVCLDLIQLTNGLVKGLQENIKSLQLFLLLLCTYWKKTKQPVMSSK